MNGLLDTLTLWLADFYLLSTALLAAVLVALLVLRQPAQRLVVAKSALVAVLLLAALCAIPRWAPVHLLTTRSAEPPETRAAPNGGVAGTVLDATEHIVSRAAADNPGVIEPAAPTVAAFQTAFPARLRVAWPTVLVGVYVVGCGCVLAWLIVGEMAARRLLRSSAPPPVDVHRLVAELAGDAPTVPDLRVSRRVDTAVAVGVWRPVVLLPTAWLELQSAAELRSVLAHELAHVRNGDLRWLAVSRSLLVLLWAQPLYWWLRRRMRLDQEVLADAAAATLSSRQLYAEQLVVWARSLSRPRLALHAAVGLWEGPSQLRRRVALLLDERLPLVAECSRRCRLTTWVTLSAAASSLSLCTFGPPGFAEAPSTHPRLPATHGSNGVAAAPDPQDLPAEHLVTQFGTYDGTTATVTVHVPFDPVQQAEPNVVAGQLTDENDQPLAGADVSLFLTTAMDAPQVSLADVRTNSDGRFRFEVTETMRQLFPDSKAPSLHDFQPDPPMLKVVARSRGRVTWEHSTVASRVGRIGVSYGHQMAPGATLRGRITGPDGKPVEGALVSVSHLGTRTSGGANSAHTDADGRYIIDDVAPFDHAEAQRQEQAQLEMQRRLAKDKESATQFWVGPTAMQVSVEHPDFAIRRVRCLDVPGTRDVQLEPAAAITGRVVDADGAPVPSAKVWLANSRPTPEELAEHGSPPPFDDAGHYLHHFETATTDAAGRYRFANLPANAYELWVDWNDWQYPGVERIVATAGRSIDAPEFVVTKGGTIRVRLVDDATGQPVPIDGDVQARFRLPSDPFSHRGVSRPIAAPADGVFVLDAYPGRFRIFCDYVMHNGQLAWLSAIGSIEDAPRVRVVDSETIDVDLRVKQHEPPQPTQLGDAASEQLQQARQLVSDGRFREAVDLANVIIKENYPAPDAWMVRAEAREKLGQIRALISEYELLLKPERVLPKTSAWVARNNLAYVLATTPDERLRDGPRAVHLAEEAIRLAGDQNFQLYDTLAAAHAETGDFQRAVAMQQKAIELAPAALRGKLIGHLQLYQAGQPLREPPAQPAEVVSE